MLSRDDSPQYLSRLAEPILAAFADARATHAGILDALGDDYTRVAPPVAGVFDGVGFWTFLSTSLCERFSVLDGVERLTSTHSLAHHWTIDGKVTVQLKSDTGNLPLDQLQLPEVARLRRLGPESIILTWDHEQSERFDPCFVQMDGKREAWRLPVAALLEDDNVDVARPDTPKPIVESARENVAQRDEDEAGEQTS
jgi:hypothetical protein